MWRATCDRGPEETVAETSPGSNPVEERVTLDALLAEHEHRVHAFHVPPIGVLGEDLHRGKPDPECYLRACAQLAVAPAICVVVEDAPARIVAARMAGCWVLAVTTTHGRAALADAHEVHGSLADVAQRLTTLLQPTG